ncbi:type I-E CRISPR-associated protein Cas6/Cse3/CasE [Streptomyces sp. 769]|uniref:type I-E CRISPR-associated protein Cas6/Cse3/CasE n=1 Tax=Streptomyces sp. 769 TaxID=1262452 RepID=UPI000581DB6B|nr:type I-E CRISPR-associated protein Cas6/Cse3/CasE [Streptomyces sp. 769]AJC62055.1 CRISPR-associated protein, Cse3 family [Streptomyces sp. 769]
MTTLTTTTTGTAWLTQLRLNTRNRTVLRDLKDGNQLHRTLMRLVPDGLGEPARATAGMLYRVDETDAGITVLAQTRQQPLINRIAPDYAHTAVKDMTAFLARLHKGLHVQYRIAANTVVQYGSLADRERAQTRLKLDRLPPARRALTGAEADDWWYIRAARNGLNVLSLVSTVPPSVDVTRQHKGRDVTHRHAITIFQGDATITDPDAVRATILNGMGRGRSFGAGLLSLAPA